jgi:hypothetical protein
MIRRMIRRMIRHKNGRLARSSLESGTKSSRDETRARLAYRCICWLEHQKLTFTTHFTNSVSVSPAVCNHQTNPVTHESVERLYEMSCASCASCQQPTEPDLRTPSTASGQHDLRKANVNHRAADFRDTEEAAFAQLPRQTISDEEAGRYRVRPQRSTKRPRCRRKRGRWLQRVPLVDHRFKRGMAATHASVFPTFSKRNQR